MANRALGSLSNANATSLMTADNIVFFSLLQVFNTIIPETVLCKLEENEISVRSKPCPIGIHFSRICLLGANIL